MEHLLIFARYPELGRVKTRLAAGIGEEGALQVYRTLLRHTREVVHALPVAKTVWLAPAGPAADLTDSWPGFVRQPQPPGDLGEKMAAAFAHAFAAGASAVLIIGTDCPGLSPAILEEARAALRTHEVVLGPARDGGYYLLGLRQLHPQFFRHKAWSTASVLADTLRDAAQLQLSVHLLPELTDIDTADDLAEWPTYQALAL